MREEDSIEPTRDENEIDAAFPPTPRPGEQDPPEVHTVWHGHWILRQYARLGVSDLADPEDVLADLLADLMAYARKQAVDWKTVERRAREYAGDS